MNEIISFEIETFPTGGGLLYWARTTTGRPIRTHNGKRSPHAAIASLCKILDEKSERDDRAKLREWNKSVKGGVIE